MHCPTAGRAPLTLSMHRDEWRAGQVQPLHLADLSGVPLGKLGVTRKQFIDAETDQYPAARKWAEVIHRQ